MDALTTQAERVLGLSRQLRELGDTPREAGGDHAAAQSSMAALGYELAGVFMDALGGKRDTPAEQLAAAKSLAQEALDGLAGGADGSAWLEQAIGLMGRCENEIESEG